MMRFFKHILLLLFLFPGIGFAQESALEKLEKLEESIIESTFIFMPDSLKDSESDSIIKERTRFINEYLADTLPVAGYDTTYFHAGDPESNLIRAAEFGQLEVVKMLVDRGVYVDASTLDGVTPLMFAAQNGDVEIMEYLIEHKADVNASPYNAVSPLHGAVRADHYEAVRILLEAGAEVDAKDELGLTPIMHASAYNYPDIAELLIENGASLKVEDQFGSRPLMMASYYNCLETADLLLEKGANPDSKDRFGFTPLMITAQHGDYDMAWMLVDKGADPTIQNNGGLHALAIAAMNGDEDLVELFAESGADINQNVNMSTNALSLAKESGNEEMVSFLIGNGARPNRRPEISEIRGGMDLNFNGDDFMMGFNAGVSERKYDTYITTGFIFRPSAVRILRPENDMLSFQFWEKRYLWPISLGKNFTLKGERNTLYGLRVHMTGAYTWGSYRGSSKKPDTRYMFMPGAGIFWRDRYFGITFDYQYVPLKVHDISSHRFQLSILGFYDFRSRIRFTRKDISWF